MSERLLIALSKLRRRSESDGEKPHEACPNGAGGETSDDSLEERFPFLVLPSKFTKTRTTYVDLTTIPTRSAV